MKVLVTGGTGYIGSHTVVEALARGDDVVIIDNHSNSAPAVLDGIEKIAGRRPRAYDLDLRNAAAVAELFAREHPDLVLHFAGLKSVGASVCDPLSYYDTNLRSTLSVLGAMRSSGVRHLVFSSSATVYGSAAAVPTAESQPLNPATPYGRTKVVIENMLADLVGDDHGWRIGVLRYFNPVGAHHSALIGERAGGRPDNLMPNIADVAAGSRRAFAIYGGDYDTPDGTPIRDFVHVEDVAAGHTAAQAVVSSMAAGIRVWNLGSGVGSSVREVLTSFEAAVGRRLRHHVVDRRPDDVAVSVAEVSRASAELGWRSTRTLDQMCVDAWRWRMRSAG